ncbi:hypothetical protein [Deinococcus pimensis]|uniref:hypothetical protein n=1 Tax=Deinococcus pimensis TaxID=309888 RepID=UPI0004818F90|nr:hypothetical protein [Deinococcus pimensis]
MRFNAPFSLCTPFTRLGVVTALTAVLLGACGSPSTLPANDGSGRFDLAGTIEAPLDATLDRTVVVACEIGRDLCADHYKVARIRTRGARAEYAIADLTPGRYRVFAWKDTNDSQTIDTGDLYGEYVRVVYGVETNVNIKVAWQGAQAGNVLTGRVTVPDAQVRPDRTVVFTCSPTPDGRCDRTNAVVAPLTPQGEYVLTDVPAGPVFVMAWQDTSRDGMFTPDDLIGIHHNVQGGPENVQVPRANVDLNLSRMPSSPQIPTGRPPAALIGVWTAGANTGAPYYTTTHGWAPQTGTGAYLKVMADGTFQKGGLLQTTVYGCSAATTSHAAGVLHVDGDTLTLDPDTTGTKYSSSCNPELNLDKTLPNTTLTLKWTVLEDGRLLLTLPDGQSTVFTRVH